MEWNQGRNMEIGYNEARQQNAITYNQQNALPYTRTQII